MPSEYDGTRRSFTNMDIPSNPGQFPFDPVKEVVKYDVLTYKLSGLFDSWGNGTTNKLEALCALLLARYGSCVISSQINDAAY